MDLQRILHEEINISTEQFWKGIEVWLSNPHVVNRRILSSVNLAVVELKEDPIIVIKHIKNLTTISQCFVDNQLKERLDVVNALDLCKYCHILDLNDPIKDDVKTYLCIKKLLPRNKNLFSPMIEFTFVNRKMNSIVYLHESLITEKQSLSPITLYNIHYTENNFLSISVDKQESIRYNASINWLINKLYPRLIKWMKSDSSGTNILCKSLTLVSVDEYAELYDKLKQKYGADLVKNWPECTDAKKFVYEDIAIASYLLTLWKKERLEEGIKEHQSFLDLGCGNGLLVYILCSEGHEGTGIDLRKRKIWDLYPKSTRLEVRTIVPSASSLFPTIDWLIGNHSDELTPWIPVIAARSSYKCRFFVLPCCAYEFSGRKYQRRNAVKSQYSEYIDYIKHVAEVCGFNTAIDRLRIPSTKRTCLIGWERNYKKEITETKALHIQEMIDARSIMPQCKESMDVEIETAHPWSVSFKPRNVIEKPRNCTQLDRKLIMDIIDIVTKNLLHEGCNIVLKDRPGITWNAGREIELCEIVKSIPTDMLNQLRKECGGIQTLLKNHNYIFTVAQGKVRFKIPGFGVIDKKRKERASVLLKVKPCWFHNNHPDGCPVTDNKCNFKH